MLFSYSKRLHEQTNITTVNSVTNTWSIQQTPMFHGCTITNKQKKTAFNLVKIHLLFRIISLIQWSVMFCRPCFNRFWGLKYIPRVLCELSKWFFNYNMCLICFGSYSDFIESSTYNKKFNHKYIWRIFVKHSHVLKWQMIQVSRDYWPDNIKNAMVTC
jgi:hypothetical protein